MTDERRSHRPLSAAVAAIVATLGLAANRAPAQDGPVLIDDRGRPRAATAAAEDPTAGVFVRDSATAADKLALAERMEKAGQWDTSADVYQEVLDQFPDRVVPTHVDAKGRADRYGSVGAVVQDRIAAWPPAGLQVYVARHANAAREMLDAAPTPDDRTTLARVVSRYFATDAGRDAALRLVELYFDRAEFVASATLIDRLLDRHPNLDDATAPAAPLRPLLLARAAITWRLAGEEARAAARAKTLNETFADARATIAGADARLADAVAAELARPRAVAATPAATVTADAWPQPFGSDDNAAVAAEPAGVDVRAPREWAKLLSFPVESAPANPGFDVQERVGFLRRQRQLGVATGILPSVANGVLYFQDNVAVHARDVATGEPPAGWAQTYPDGGRYRLAGALPTPRGAQLAVTVAGDRVLAILGQTDAFTRNVAMMNGNAVVNAVGGTRVVCLDRGTGKLIWQASPAMSAPAAADDAAREAGAEAAPRADEPQRRPVAAPADADGPRRAAPVAPDVGANANPARNANADAVRASEPCGSVLVANDSAYVVSRGLRSGGFQDVYLNCYALADGSLRWTRHLASGNPPLSPHGDDSPTAGDVADSHIAYADGRVVVCTDLGAIVSVDAADGTIGWLTLYPRPRPQPQQQMRFAMNAELAAAGRVAPAYAGNPVIVRDGRVITMPVDAESLLVHDAATGRPIARVPTRRRIEGGQRTDRIDVLAGLAGDRLVLASSWAITVLDYAKLVADAAPAAANADAAERVVRVEDVLVNHRPVISPNHPDFAIRGRPFLTEGSLYVSTVQRLYRFTADARRVLDRYPAGEEDLDARGDESPGNVVALGGTVVVAGPERVAVYAEMSQLRRRLDAAIAADPRAVAPRLDYAQAMFDTDRRDEALTWIDSAIEQLDNAGGLPTPGPARDKIFDACMAMLRRLEPPRLAADEAAMSDERDGRAAPTGVTTREPLLAEASRPFAAGLAERLSRLADVPQQQVAARLAGASIARRSGDNAAAVAAYQSLLDEPAWATLSVRDENADEHAEGVPLRTLARQAIDEIAKADADAYAAIEARAAAAVEAERQQGGASLAGLFAIVDRYPNAQAARDAMTLAAARVAAVAPDAAPAPAELRRLGAQLTDAAQRATLNRTLYALAAARGDVNAALGRARRVAQLDAGGELPAWPAANAATTAPDASASGSMPAAQVVAQLQRAAFDAEERRLPDVRADLTNVPSFAADRAAAREGIAMILAPQPGPGARADRVLATRRDNRKLLIFAAGGAAPLHEVEVPGLSDAAEPTWVGDRVYLVQPGRIACVDAGAGRLEWVREAAQLGGGEAGVAENGTPARPAAASLSVPIAASLAPAGVSLAGARPDVGDAAPGGVDDDLARAEAQLQRQLMRANDERVIRGILQRQNVLAQRRMIERNNRLGRVANVGNLDEVAVAPGWVPDAADAGGAETIARSRVLPGGGAILATTRGRLVALAADGSTRWQSRFVGGRAPAFLDVAGGDQVVVAGTDERVSRLLVLDAATGRETLRREFAGGDARQRIVNVATGEHGLLAAVLADGLIVWDLGDGGTEPLGTWRAKSSAAGDDGASFAFSASTGPRHVAFCGDKLLVATNVGGDGPHVRVFEALTAQPARVGDVAAGNVAAERRLAPAFPRDRREGDEPINLRVHRDRVLIDTGAAMTSVSVLDAAQPAWKRALPDVPTALSAQSPMLVRGGLIAIGWPREQAGQSSAVATLEIYSRETLPNGREVGMAVDEIALGKIAGTNAPEGRRTRRQPSGPRILDKFQAVDGGLYLLTNAGRLTFLPGALAK